jgi:hypothetical protein
MEPRNQFPPGWESTPCLLKRSTDIGSGHLGKNRRGGFGNFFIPYQSSTLKYTVFPESTFFQTQYVRVHCTLLSRPQGSGLSTQAASCNGRLRFCHHNPDIKYIIGTKAEIGGPQISSANRKSAHLWTYKICYICGPFACEAICGFADCRPDIFSRFADLRFGGRNFSGFAI